MARNMEKVVKTSLEKSKGRQIDQLAEQLLNYWLMSEQLNQVNRQERRPSAQFRTVVDLFQIDFSLVQS